MIKKLPENSLGFYRNWYDFCSARDAFSYLLSNKLFNSEGKTVLLPNFIGYSDKEGSGVFDPVRLSTLAYDFYKLDGGLNVNVEDYKRKLEMLGQNCIVVIIHYYGYVDPNYEKLVRIAKNLDVFIIEDQAHSFFTDLVGGVVGRQCDASIYSLHKMFPPTQGGALSYTYGNETNTSSATKVSSLALCYDLSKIAEIRINNALTYTDFFRDYKDFVTLIRPDFPSGSVPQSFPILLKVGDRDKIYEDLNLLGFGVVSLYHTMIIEISKRADFFEVHKVSSNIINLPLHQDANKENLIRLCRALVSLLKKYN
jgi:dTDP-4-amino-4,6-dideoxygalactose transaminase